MSIEIETFICPICHDLLLEPVLASDGIVYNDQCIKRHIEGKQYPKSPITRNAILKTFQPVRLIKTIIIELINRSDILDQWSKELTIEQLNSYSLNVLDDLLNVTKLPVQYKNYIYGRKLKQIICENKSSEEKIMNYLNSHSNDDRICDYVDESGTNTFAYCCENRLSRVAIELLHYESFDHNIILLPSESSLLMIACTQQLVDVALELLKKPNINYNHVAKNGNNALIIACDKDLEKIAIEMLDNRPDIDYNHAGEIGWSALLVSCYIGGEQTAHKLLEKPNIQYNHTGGFKNTSSLIQACKNRMNGVALKLLAFSDINYNYIDGDDRCALSVACSNGMEEVVAELLKRPDIMYNHVDKDGDSPLMLACEIKNENIALQLLDQPGIDYNRYNNKGQNALDKAIDNKMENVIIKIISFPDYQFSDKETSLLIESCKNKMERVALKLLDLKGVDQNLDAYSFVNAKNESAMACAYNNGMIDVSEKILDHCMEGWLKNKKMKISNE